MCEKCVGLVEKNLPKIGPEDYGRLLMGATCFPFGGPELIEPQLIELAAKTDGTLEACLAWANADFDRTMTEHGFWDQFKLGVQ